MLPKYASLLKEYINDSLAIKGYYNFDGALLSEHDSSYILSKKRAKVVYDTLIGAGFNSRLLSFEGQGNSKMVIQHPVKEDEMRRNIRVEISIFR